MNIIGVMKSNRLIVFMIIWTIINLSLVACCFLRTTEHLSPLDNVVTVDSAGNLNALPADKNLFYCDGSTECKQPFKAPEIEATSFKVGTWVISENADGFLTFVKNNAADESDKGHIKFSHDGNIWANRSTSRGWLSDILKDKITWLNGTGPYGNSGFYIGNWFAHQNSNGHLSFFNNGTSKNFTVSNSDGNSTCKGNWIC